MSSPFVSVVVTSYNQRESLERAVNSVLNQTYQNTQIVITDDYSTDDSRDYLIKLKEQYPNKVKLVFQEQNVGIPKNKNAGFKACDGELISYLDGDDFYYPEKIEKEVNCFLEKPHLDIVYSNFQYIDINDVQFRIWADNAWSALRGYIFPAVICREFPKNTLYRCELMKKKVLKSINYYDENIRAYHDWDSRIRMTKNANVGYSNYIGSAYVDDPAGISKTEKKQQLMQEMIYVINKNMWLIGNDKNLLNQVKRLKGEIQFPLNLMKPRAQRFAGFVSYAVSTPGGLKKVLIYLKKRFK